MTTTVRELAALPELETADRIGRLRPVVDEAGCAGLIVTNLANIRYLTGFTGSAGTLLVTSGAVLLTTDGRYHTQAREQLDAAGVTARIEIGGLAEQHRALADAAPVGRLALESTAVSWAAQRVLVDVLVERELVPTAGLVEGLRRVKDAGESARIEAAAAVADEALARVVPLLAEGRTEAEIALELDFAMRRLGAEGSAFETIVAGGPNSAKPHARPGPRPVGRGELVVIDFGAKVDGYRSDMTRTFCVGEPDDRLADMYEIVLAAQRAGVHTVRAGRAAAEVDGACRRLIEEAGLGDRFVHATGHGVGLDIHEAPAVAATSADTLQEHSVVTVEPGVYVPDLGGVRIEDTLIVTASDARAVTRFPKELLVA